MPPLGRKIVRCSDFDLVELNIRSLKWSGQTMSDIQERVIKMVAEQLGVKEDDVKTTSSFVEDLRYPMRTLKKLQLFRTQLPTSTRTVKFKASKDRSSWGGFFLPVFFG